MRCLSSIAGAVLFVLLSVVTVAAQVAADQPDTSTGAWVGTAFWIGFTLLLLFGAILIAYQSMKRPNRR